MIIFVCDSRDFHAVDWFHVVSDLLSFQSKKVILVTDISDSLNRKRNFREDDIVMELFNINFLLTDNRSFLADIWRNVLKILILPIQVIMLARLARRYPNAIFHAHSMYYIFLCWLANLRFIATPMGSDVLVRPDKSNLYRFMTIQSLSAASFITVDSERMKQKIRELCGRSSVVVQNGIDVRRICSIQYDVFERNNVVSIRGLYPNYRIEKLLDSRDKIIEKVNINFVYPFYETGYRDNILGRMTDGDKDLGRLGKDDLYYLLASTLLVISIPESDSSPRSVYEAIFAGCCVAVTYSPWVDSLPECMRERITLIDLDDDLWLESALSVARRITSVDYIPSETALVEYDQYESMRKVCRDIYKVI